MSEEDSTNVGRGRLCPACGEDTGVWSIMAANWPTRIQCPHCDATLTYSISIWRTFILVVLPLIPGILILSFAVVFSVRAKMDRLGIVISLLLFCLLWQMFEFCNALHWRRTKTLREVAPKKHDDG